MFFRQTSAEFSAQSGQKNRSQLKSLVDDRKVPGLIAYVDGQPAGWVSVAPREQFGRVERSPLFKRDDIDPYIGTPEMFAACGFEEVARPKPGRLLMRYSV